MSKYQIYKYGLYGRCSICKSVIQEKCRFCGEQYFFTDSSKPGFYLCTNCNTHNQFICPKPECHNQSKILRTPNNEEEKQRIDEFVNRARDEEKNRRTYVVKSSVKKTVVQPIEIDCGSPSSLGDSSFEFKDPDFIPTQKKTKSQVSVQQPANNVLKTGKPKVVEAQQKKDEKEAVLIREYWAGKITENELSTQTKDPAEPEKERRIVNEFYEDKNQNQNEKLDTKKTFINTYDEIVYYDCYVCGEKEVRIICERCGSDDHFSLNYDSLSCKCGNELKIISCRCGAKIGHNDFFLISNGVKWQYSQSRSYYNYRKGRMMVFSKCPDCGIFSAEKCSSCGSKVNFGTPNVLNQVYCKHCGTINQYTCENPKCNKAIKVLKNPSSVEEKLDWINKTRNIRAMVNADQFSAEPQQPKNSALSVPVIAKVPLNTLSDSFMDNMQKKNKDLITNSFLNEVEERVQEEKNLNQQLVEHNKKQIEYIYHTKTGVSDYVWYLIGGIIAIIGVAVYFYLNYFM